MSRAWSLAIVVLLLMAWGCAAEGPDDATAADADAAEAESDLDPEDPTILRRPFTAEQIRDEWIEGLTLKLQQETLDGMAYERWTVITASEEAAHIESTPLDEDGNAVGEPKVQRLTWTELRDHATFPADAASRTETSRHTPLGKLEGWLYVMRDEEADSRTELFFAREFPGAPVHARTTRGSELVVEMVQTERERPE